jgi:CHAT domain
VNGIHELKLRIDGSRSAGYRVTASGRAGDYSGTFAHPFDEKDLKILLLSLGNLTRTDTRRVESSEKQLIIDFGSTLFDTVFAGDVGIAYRLARSDAERAGESLRVTLALSGAPDLMELPWEYLYDEPEFLAISKWTPVVRYLDTGGALVPLKVELPLRILAMVSSPEGAVQLDVQQEREKLEQALARLTERGAVEITWLDKATLTSLLRALQGGPFHVFHFIGHGEYDKHKKDGILLLEDDSGRPHAVTGRDLGVYLGEHKELRLAVINACDGARSPEDDPFAGVATGLVQRRIPAVIAMQFEVTDSAAITFAGEFYWKLADCGIVDAALAFARQAIYANNDIEWATPVLFLRVADGRIFDVPDAPLARPDPVAPASPPLRVTSDEPAGTPPPAGEGEPRRRGRRRVPVILASGAALGAAVLAGLAVLVFGGGGGTTPTTRATPTTTTTPTTTKPNPPVRRWTLRTALPVAVLKACPSSTRLDVPGALAVRVKDGMAHFTSSFACEQPAGGILRVQYSVARSRQDLDDYFEWRTNGASLPLSVAGTCGQTTTAVNNWEPAGHTGHELLPSGDGVGRVLCYDRTLARIEWTDPRRLVYGFIEGPSRARVFAWWTTAAGPNAATPT